MSEEIKAGEMVWVRDDGCAWGKDQREYISNTSEGLYLCWTKDKSDAHTWDEVTAKNPHEKKCELLKEGEELWEYSNGRFGKYSLEQLYYSQIFKRLQGFVVELGNGEQVKVDHPIKFTGNKDTILGEGLSNIETDRHPNRCKIIGSIMSEQKQC